jgi:hypothetical protein
MEEFASMGSTLLIACLWGAVLVYWLWSRRPLGDPVGSFRNDLRVLGSATPGRVVPANRLGAVSTVIVHGPPRRVAVPEEIVGPPVPLAAAARHHSRQELRRRRRDVMAVLALAALVSLFAAVLTGSAVLVLLQLLIDLVLGIYVYLLARATGGQAKAGRPTLVAGANRLAKPMSTLRLAGATYMQPHVPAEADWADADWGEADWAEPSYGDFRSYASLANSQGN